MVPQNTNLSVQTFSSRRPGGVGAAAAVVTQPWAEAAMDDMAATIEAQLAGASSRVGAAESAIDACQRDSEALAAGASRAAATIAELTDQVRTLGDVVNQLQAAANAQGVACPACQCTCANV